MENWLEVCKKEDVPEGRVKVFTISGHRIAVCHVKDPRKGVKDPRKGVEGENFYATQDVCTHDNGPLGEGELIEYAIECPRHGARFDVRTGKVLCLPAVIPIKTYKVQVDGDAVKVEDPRQGVEMSR